MRPISSILVLLLLTTLVAQGHTADTAATEAAVNARPNDYQAWAAHAAALIQLGGTQSGEQQKNTLQLALQCAKRSQEVCIKNSRDIRVAMNQGDELCLGVLGMALALNNQNKEALDAINKAIAIISGKDSPSLADMQAKTNLEAFRNTLITTNVNEKADAQQAKAAELTMPLVTWRSAAIGSTKVARIANPLAHNMVVKATHMRNNTPITIAPITLVPQITVEIGHMEGFSFKTGDTLHLLRIDSGATTSIPVP